MRRFLIASVVMGLLAAACGDSGETTTTAPAATTSTTTTSTTSTTVADTEATTTTAAAGGMDVVRDATVQIVAEGTFVDPFEGVQSNVPGSGSGFIIDAAGLAVTNNHVVTGAALLQVFFAGDTQPRNARVLGVSECSDLAVIDIEGDGYNALSWFEGDIEAGLAIFAAGYPLGDPEYTVLDGVVSKARAAGETTWASVDSVIEHSADTLPGNSGGPIVTEDGQVVAVNYAGNEMGQSFAIGRTVARRVVEQLAAGEDVDSIGINGEAFFGGEFAGIWVYSVESGSPADVAGIEAGDLLLTMEDLDLATDGTMADYCDILRSHTAGDVLDVVVYRVATEEILEGQINGRVLEPAFSLASEVEDVGGAAVGDDGLPEYTNYVQVTDDSAAIMVSVPAEWSDTLGVPWDFGGDQIGPALSAAPDLDLFFGTWGTPGVFIAASDVLPITPTELLDGEDFSSSCAYAGRFDYDDGLYVGQFDLWEQCGAEGSTFVVIVAQPADGAFTALVEILIAAERDFAATDEIIATFTVGGDLAVGTGGAPAGDPGLAAGLLCADIAALGFGYQDAAGYWVREGAPNRMDEDRNGIPCETIYSVADMDVFYLPVSSEPSGLFCADLADRGWFYADALAYWILEGRPNRMDADRNGIPCETIYRFDEIDPVLFFEYYVG